MRLAWILLAIAGIAQDEMSKDKHPWMKYKVGTTVSFKMKIDAGGQQVEGTMKQELTELKDKSYTTKTAFDVMGQQNEENEVEDIPTKGSEETLKIGDKEYKCTIWNSKSKRGEKESTNRIWVADGMNVPLKLEIKDAENTSTILASAVGDKIKVGEKEYDCVRLEGDMATDMGKAKAKFWMNADVPGMAVKLSFDIKGDMGESQMTFELDKVDIAK